MNDILDNLFYKEKLGIGNKTTFIKKVRERHPEIKVKDIQDYIKNQEVRFRHPRAVSDVLTNHYAIGESLMT